NIIKNYINIHGNLNYGREVNSIIKGILNPEVDREIKNYFKSHYAIQFIASRTLKPTDSIENVSTKWHCDSGPTNFINIMCYLDDESDHNSSTLFMSEETTDKLKKIGYAYCNLDYRQSDITDLLNEHNIKNEVFSHNFKAGESIVFCPTKLIHKAHPPRPGSTRTTVDICLIPSPVPWEEAIARGFTPGGAYVQFQNRAVELLKCTNSDYSNITNISSNSKEGPDDELIHLSSDSKINSRQSILFHLTSIFSNKAYIDVLCEKLIEADFLNKNPTVSHLIIAIKLSFKNELNWDNHFETKDLRNFEELLSFERNYTETLYTYEKVGKYKPEVIFWPTPNNKSQPQNKYNIFPYVKKYRIINKSTAIGSAGSCFAMEIAEVLQEEGFNYVITELGDNPISEAIIDDYKVNSGKAKYSANYGTIFNTPSLKQLAEKAFGLKKFRKILVDKSTNLYMDPYRENVYFNSPESYINDYDKHINAIQRSLLESEVFIFTAGLNECWELPDKTVISRNPKIGLHQLIRSRVLTVEENTKNILDFFNIVKSRNKNFKLILTLSPIPLMATARSNTHHVIEANSHSKSVLRVAIDEAVKKEKEIYYFPSYELITECVEDPWEEDHKHIKRSSVPRVVEMFYEMFLA
ncbi:MAG: GSCFA domain-containing protein, partial [Cycloclasticus sp.]